MSSSQQWLPRSIECLRSYTPRQFTQDLIAGLTVGLVALPLAMAFAIASGVPPQAGLYTAVVAGFLISALGGSRVQIGGPTGAFVVIVAGIVMKFGLGGLALVGQFPAHAIHFGRPAADAPRSGGIRIGNPVMASFGNDLLPWNDNAIPSGTSASSIFRWFI
jgi:hypothetical protein